jgi:hypothetical protein
VTIEQPVSIETLLDLPDEEFVKAAYLLVLGRNPDPSGLAHYSRQVREGEEKAAILAELARSEEGRRTSSGRPEIIKLINELSRCPRSSLLGSVQRFFREDGRNERQQRVMENRILALNHRVIQAERRYEGLRMSISEIVETIGKQQSGFLSLDAEDKDTSGDSVDFRRVARTFAELKAAIQTKKTRT